MTEVTDPAEEFAFLCRALHGSPNKSGADWLAQRFNTEPWTHEFYQVLFAIIERGYYLIDLVGRLPETEHISDQVTSNLLTILEAFNAQGLGANWNNTSARHLGPEHVSPILVLSAIIRPHVSYPKLGVEEQKEVLACVDELLVWLTDHQLVEQDFLREAMINGLKQFRFRLERLEWLGSGYAIESLKEVIGAYFALERGHVDDGSMPIVSATLKKVAEGLQDIYSKVGVAKEATDKADFLLKAYGAASLYAHANAGGIVGLLTFGG